MHEYAGVDDSASIAELGPVPVRARSYPSGSMMRTSMASRSFRVLVSEECGEATKTTLLFPLLGVGPPSVVTKRAMVQILR